MKIEVTITTLQRTTLEVRDDFPLYGEPVFTAEQQEILRMGASTDVVARRIDVALAPSISTTRTKETA